MAALGHPMAAAGPCPHAVLSPGMRPEVTGPLVTVTQFSRCLPNPCFPGVPCTESGGGFRCGPCPAGFTGNGTHCSDINEVKPPGTAWNSRTHPNPVGFASVVVPGKAPQSPPDAGIPAVPGILCPALPPPGGFLPTSPQVGGLSRQNKSRGFVPHREGRLGQQSGLLRGGVVGDKIY